MAAFFKTQFQSELRLPGGFGSIEDSPKIGAEGNPSGDIEVRLIENIEYFPSKFDALTLPKLEVPLKRHVDVG